MIRELRDAAAFTLVVLFVLGFFAASALVELRCRGASP